MSNAVENSATSLNKYEINKSVRAKVKKSVPKPVLCTPYKIEWPQVDQKVQEKVISYLKKFFQENNLRLESLSKESLKNLKKAEKKTKLREHALKNKSSITAKLRSQLALGVQEVTRNLENKNLSLIIVDRSSPWQLHRHLIQLSTLRECPSMAINQLSETVSPLLSLSRLCVLAVKNFKDEDSDIFQPLVEFVAPLCPKYEIPWLDAERQLMEMKQEHVSSITADQQDDDSNGQDRESSGIEAGDMTDEQNDNDETLGKDGCNYATSCNKVVDKMEHDGSEDDETNSEDHLLPYTDLYIKVSEAHESELACEIVDVDNDDMWSYNMASLKEKVVKKDNSDKMLIFNCPTNSSVKRFHSAEVRKIQKNQFKKKKLN